MALPHRSSDRLKRLLAFGWRVLIWLVLLGLVAVLVVAVLVPRIAGATPYSILSGSMTPTYPVGTLVVSRPVDPDQIGVGTVVTYQLESGEPTVITHRVVQQAINDQGEPLFQTRGDANDAPDQKWVRPVQVRGELWYAVPYLGYVNNWLTGHQRQTAVYVVAAGLGGYAAVMFVGAMRDRRKEGTEA